MATITKRKQAIKPNFVARVFPPAKVSTVGLDEHMAISAIRKTRMGDTAK